MDKRYQVFISSTFEDLKIARQTASETVLDMRHMPVGMEQFPASPEEQFSYIKRIIDSSDYYILIIGGKYGSVSPETHISYTEMEYDYAIKKGIPVLAFIRRSDTMLATEIESDSEKGQKLQAFIQKIGKLAVLWNRPEDLPKKIMQSLNEAMENFPRTGWIRAVNADSAETLGKLTNALEENATLKAENEKLKIELGKNTTSKPSNIAGLEEVVPQNLIPDTFEKNTTWKDLLRFIALETNLMQSNVAEMQLAEEYKFSLKALKIIRSQFEAFDLIITRHSDYFVNLYNVGSAYWILTPKGKEFIRQALVVRTAKKEPEDS